jgi:hypothetical protein
MSVRAPRVMLVWCVVLLLGQTCSPAQARAPEQSRRRPISFYIYADTSIAEYGDNAVRTEFQEFVDHLGNRSRYGSVGIALNYPYLTYVTGRGPGSFAIDTAKMKRYEANVRVAHEMGLPVVVGFNDGPWFHLAVLSTSTGKRPTMDVFSPGIRTAKSMSLFTPRAL